MSGHSTPTLRSSEISSITYEIQAKRSTQQQQQQLQPQQPNSEAEITKGPVTNTPVASKHVRIFKPTNSRSQSRTANRALKPTHESKGSKVATATTTSNITAITTGSATITTNNSNTNNNGITVKSRAAAAARNTERLAKEFRDIKVSGLRQIRELKLNGDNIFHWTFLLLPDMAPYNRAAFRAEIKFPETYPQQPPIITIRDIYHPNIDKNGFVCLHCLAHWARTMKIEDVLGKLFSLIKDPEPHHPMRFEIADEYLKDRELYMRKAAESARIRGLQRPRY